jgi:hypothetical protein
MPKATKFLSYFAIVGLLTIGSVEANPTDSVELVMAGGRKTVTVSARSEGQALVTAQSQNPGWQAVSARKVNPNPKSYFWMVTLVK